MLKLIIKLFVLFYICNNVKARSVSPDIVNGFNATVTPFHAHLIIRPFIGAPQAQTFVGSGAIISNVHILTVAQNVHTFSHWEVLVGDINRFELTSHSAIISHIHPDYNPSNLDNNIAIIQIQVPIVSAINVHPIELPLPGESLHPLENELGTITGFGFTTNTGNFAVYLQQAFLRVQPQSVCLNEWPHLLPSIDAHFCTLYDNQMTPANICGGDQGAPFFLILRGQNILMGIASFVNPDCTGPNHAAVFVRVSHHLNWISGIIN